MHNCTYYSRGDSMAYNYKIKLKQYRKSQHLTLVELSEKTWISKSTLSRIERGEIDPHLSAVVNLAKYFGCELSEFVEITE